MESRELASASDVENFPPLSRDDDNALANSESMAAVTPTHTPPTRAANRSTKGSASRHRDSRLPSARTGSVFDRLYRTQTAASAASKVWTPLNREIRRGTYTSPASSGRSVQSRGTPSPNTKRLSSSVGIDESARIFERLHITGTVANASKRVTQASNSIRFTPTKSARSPARAIPSRKSPLNSASKNRKVGYVYSPRMQPLTKLYFDSKYHPGIGKERIEPIKLGNSFFQSFCEYENGGLTSQQIAREIIIAFFKKDFSSGRHWELHEPNVDPRPGEENVFNVKMCATYDWQDAFRIASAQGVVKCDPDAKEICVVNYIYDITSDL